MFNTQFNTKVQQLCSDNRVEFLSLLNFLLEEGILFQHYCVYTPQQNSVIEWKHRHILETVRALYFQSHLPITFWGECILTVVHIINHLPTFLLHKKTPFEIIYNKLPDYSRMWVFGCIAFATIVNPSSKFSLCATKCIFLCYPMGQKDYKLYDIATKKIFTNRDVVFLKDTFYHSPQVNPTAHNPPALPIPLPLMSDFFSHLPPSANLIDPFNPPLQHPCPLCLHQPTQYPLLLNHLPLLIP